MKARSSSLLSYLASRLVFALFTVYILTSLIFILLRVLPGDPVSAMFPNAPPEYIEEYRERYGVNKPIWRQYIDYYWSLLHGDLGESLITNKPVGRQIMEVLPKSIELMLGGMVWVVLLGFGLSAVAAWNHGGVLDSAIRTVTTVAYSIPLFFLGLMLQYFFGVVLDVLPIYGAVEAGLRPSRVTGMITVDAVLSGDMQTVRSVLGHLALPWFSMGLWGGTTLAQMGRNRMVEITTEDFIFVARTKGVGQAGIIFVHTMRNALLPMVSYLGMQVSTLLAGAAIIEIVFSIRGLGAMFIRALGTRDFALIEGTVLLFTLIVVIMSLIVDLTYSFLDPRVEL
jgi:peptide/nickel transport system permease protein